MSHLSLFHDPIYNVLSNSQIILRMRHPQRIQRVNHQKELHLLHSATWQSGWLPSMSWATWEVPGTSCLSRTSSTSRRRRRLWQTLIQGFRSRWLNFTDTRILPMTAAWKAVENNTRTDYIWRRPRPPIMQDSIFFILICHCHYYDQNVAFSFIDYDWHPINTFFQQVIVFVLIYMYSDIFSYHWTNWKLIVTNVCWVIQRNTPCEELHFNFI